MCNEEGLMVGTFVLGEEASISVDMMATELAKDFGTRLSYSHSDLEEYFLNMLKSY